MSFGFIGTVALAMVSVAALGLVVGSPNTGGIIKAFGDAFAGGLKAATGKG